MLTYFYIFWHSTIPNRTKNTETRLVSS